jgi:hypothetical protein
MHVPHLGTPRAWIDMLGLKFLGLMILNSIVCFRNIIIILIINIINEIINKFKRKYYY